MKYQTMKTVLPCLFVCALVQAQPNVGVPLTNVACAAGPGTETLPENPGADGFYPLFDGTSFKGWWESCKTGHSAEDRTNGGIWVIDPTEKAIVAMQSNTYAGSIMMTNKKFDHYELMFDFWSTYGNDAGIFNRTTDDGRCWQTTLDYISGSSVGGGFGENYNAPNLDFYTFGNNGSTINNLTNWTNLTKNNSPANFGCPAAGCGAADWAKVWDVNGWNQIRIKFYGGAVAGTKIHMQAWVRRLANAPGTPESNWVPTFDDSLSNVTAASYIGLQIHHGNTRWKLPSAQGKGAWFRNIKIRPLNDRGVPATVSARPERSGMVRSDLKIASGMLVGTVAGDHEITVRDVEGRTMAAFRGASGSVSYRLPPDLRGILFVAIRGGAGTELVRMNRI